MDQLDFDASKITISLMIFEWRVRSIHAAAKILTFNISLDFDVAMALVSSTNESGPTY